VLIPIADAPVDGINNVGGVARAVAIKHFHVDDRSARRDTSVRARPNMTRAARDGRDVSAVPREVIGVAESACVSLNCYPAYAVIGKLVMIVVDTRIENRDADTGAVQV